MRKFLSILLFITPLLGQAGSACPLRKEIGQMFVVSISEATDLKAFHDYAEKNELGGVMLFNWNLGNIHHPNDLISLTNTIQEGRATGMFIAVDQEGGLIQRLNQSRGFTMLPSAMRVGATGDDHYAYEIGRIAGKELKAVGINWNFAPSVDVATNPDNPVVAKIKRSYSKDPLVVGRMASQMIEGMSKEGLMTSAKHFPGHGDTVGDSHAESVSINKPWEEIVKTELVPFVEAINHGVLSVMVGHINVPCFTDLPASLSPELLQGQLRDKMGFKGLIVTDDLSMGAIAAHYSLGDAAEMAIMAGNDILLANHGTEKVMLEHLCKITQQPEKEALRKRISESYERILGIKKSLGIDKVTAIAPLTKPISELEHQQLSAKIFELTGGLPSGTQGPITGASSGLQDLMGDHKN